MMYFEGDTALSAQKCDIYSLRSNNTDFLTTDDTGFTGCSVK